MSELHKAISDPACKLIDAVRSGIGTLYEPRRIRLKAKATAVEITELARANADASMIRANADHELAKRAAERLSFQEMRRQQNIDVIVAEALLELPDTVSADPVEPDWISSFFDGCEDVSDGQLQTLWAKLLATEVSRPGTFSSRTLALLKQMSRAEADAFERLCAGAWSVSDGALIPLTDSIKSSELEFLSLSFGDFLDLVDAGLVSAGTSLAFTVDDGDLIQYANSPHRVHVFSLQAQRVCDHQKPTERGFPALLMTRAGKDLLTIVQHRDEQVYLYGMRVLHGAGIALSCPMPILVSN